MRKPDHTVWPFQSSCVAWEHQQWSDTDPSRRKVSHYIAMMTHIRRLAGPSFQALRHECTCLHNLCVCQCVIHSAKALGRSGIVPRGCVSAAVCVSVFDQISHTGDKKPWERKKIVGWNRRYTAELWQQPKRCQLKRICEDVMIVKLCLPSHCDINAVDVETEVPSELFRAFVDQADEGWDGSMEMPPESPWQLPLISPAVILNSAESRGGSQK